MSPGADGVRDPKTLGGALGMSSPCPKDRSPNIVSCDDPHVGDRDGDGMGHEFLVLGNGGRPVGRIEVLAHSSRGTIIP